MIIEAKNGTYEFDETKQRQQSDVSFFTSFKGIHKETGKPIVVRKLLHESQIPSETHTDAAEHVLTHIHNLHPSIAQILDVCIVNNEVYVIREYIQGISLQQLLFTPDFPQYRNPFLMLHIIKQVLELLEVIHNYGIIHRSICPQHIFIPCNELGEINTLELQIKVVAFEYAQIQGNSLFAFSRTPIMRTYSPPELVLKFDMLITTVTDIYSTGVCLYECFSRKPAFDTDNKDLLFHTQVAFPLKKHWNIPKELFAVIQKATHKHVFTKPPSRYSHENLEYALKLACSMRYLQATDMKHDIELYIQHLHNSKKQSLFKKIANFTKR